MTDTPVRGLTDIRKKSLEERAAAMKAANRPVYPRGLASREARAVRVKEIRRMMGLTLEAFAKKIRISAYFCGAVENGRKNCPQAHLERAERALHNFYCKQYRAKIKSQRTVDTLRQQAESAELKISAITMYVLGTPVEQIAEKLHISPVSVRTWVSDLE